MSVCALVLMLDLVAVKSPEAPMSPLLCQVAYIDTGGNVVAWGYTHGGSLTVLSVNSLGTSTIRRQLLLIMSLDFGAAAVKSSGQI